MQLIHSMESKWKLKQVRKWILPYVLAWKHSKFFHPSDLSNTKIRYLPAIWQFFISIAGNEGRVWFIYNLALFNSVGCHILIFIFLPPKEAWKSKYHSEKNLKEIRRQENKDCHEGALFLLGLRNTIPNLFLKKIPILYNRHNRVFNSINFQPVKETLEFTSTRLQWGDYCRIRNHRFY